MKLIIYLSLLMFSGQALSVAFVQEHDIEDWPLIEKKEHLKVAVVALDTHTDIYSKTDKELVCVIKVKTKDKKPKEIIMKMGGHACNKLLLQKDLTAISLDYHKLKNPQQKKESINWVVNIH